MELHAWIMLGLLIAFAGVLALWQTERRQSRRRRRSRRAGRDKLSP
jgi:hypothetical protein